jgi:hypothetical protein
MALEFNADGTKVKNPDTGRFVNVDGAIGKSVLKKYKQASPVPVKQPSPAKEASPVPVKQASPVPVKQASPVPVKQASPVPAKQASPVQASPKSGVLELTHLRKQQSESYKVRPYTPMKLAPPVPLIAPSTIKSYELKIGMEVFRGVYYGKIYRLNESSVTIRYYKMETSDICEPTEKDGVLKSVEQLAIYYMPAMDGSFKVTEKDYNKLIVKGYHTEYDYAFDDVKKTGRRRVKLMQPTYITINEKGVAWTNNP